MSFPTVQTEFTTEDMEAFKPAMKVGILATVNDQGLPHLTLIASLMASGPRQVCWGQFVEGTSKEYIQRNPKVGFAIMTLNKELWRGKATFTHARREGPEYDHYNNTPTFRYNAYFGIHTVYYMDLEGHTGRTKLPMGAVVLATVQTQLARLQSRLRVKNWALNPLTRQLVSKTGNLKFLSYVGSDGYPVIVPVLQAVASSPEHVLFAVSAYGDELRAIPAGATVALFAMSLDMEDVLVRGAYQGIKRWSGADCAGVTVDWVYNSMPPVAGQIYPLLPLEAVRDI